jgi:hypothetical protein
MDGDIMSGFYRIGEDGALLHAPNGLATPTGSYVSSNHNAYVYPIDGAWRWFDDEAAALVFFAGAQTPPLTPVQVRIALRQAGITSAMVDAVIAAISDPVERDIAATYWEYATQIHRDHPLIASFATGLGLTSEQVDTMWQAAAIT